MKNISCGSKNKPRCFWYGIKFHNYWIGKKVIYCTNMNDVLIRANLYIGKIDIWQICFIQKGLFSTCSGISKGKHCNTKVETLLSYGLCIIPSISRSENNKKRPDSTGKSRIKPLDVTFFGLCMCVKECFPRKNIQLV